MGEKMKIVIAYDGSDCALAALDDLQRAGLPEVAQAVVVSVAETASPPNQRSDDDLHQSVVGEDIISATTTVMTQEAYQLTLIANERIQQLFPRWEVSAAPNWGSPASCILAQADLLKADLIVVGAQGHSLLGRFILGSVSHTVVTEGRCSVRIGRGRAAQDSPLKLLVGVDGSKGAEAALQAVVSRAWPEGTKVRVVTAFDLVVPPLTSYLMPPAVKWINEDNEAEKARARRLAEWAAQLLSEAHLQSSICLKVGNPKHALLEEAEEWQADCIFVGARGLNRIDRFLLGSVSTAVATRAHCSVEVVRGPWAEEKSH